MYSHLKVKERIHPIEGYDILSSRSINCMCEKISGVQNMIHTDNKVLGTGINDTPPLPTSMCRVRGIIVGRCVWLLAKLELVQALGWFSVGKCHSAHLAGMQALTTRNLHQSRHCKLTISKAKLFIVRRRLWSAGEVLTLHSDVVTRGLIICFAPLTQAIGLPSHQRGGCAVATGILDVAPVTRHLKGSIYMLGSPQLLVESGLKEMVIVGNTADLPIWHPTPLVNSRRLP